MLATGSRPAPDRIGAVDGSIPVLSIDEAVARDDFAGRVLIVDLRGDVESALCAEHLASRGAEVTIATPFLSFGPHLGFTHVNDILRRLYGLGCALRAEHGVRRHGRRRGRDTPHPHAGGAGRDGSTRSWPGCPGAPTRRSRAAVERSGARLLVAGDAVAPRTALHAFREGDDAGRAA